MICVTTYLAWHQRQVKRDAQVASERASLANLIEAGLAIQWLGASRADLSALSRGGGSQEERT